MHRMGHGSMRAALIYQHATTERDRQIADRLSTLVESSATGRPATTGRVNCTPIARNAGGGATLTWWHRL